MNQPPKRRRYAGLVDRREPPLDGFHDSGITNSDYAALLANVIAEFNNLETELPKMLAMLLGLSDETPAGYVYRAIPGVSARYHVMRALLEKAPNNSLKGKEYDAVLSEFDHIRQRRNDYVHGLWYTHNDTGKVFLAVRDEHGYAFLQAREEPIKNLDAFLKRIGNLKSRVASMFREHKKTKSTNKPH